MYSTRCHPSHRPVSYVQAGHNCSLFMALQGVAWTLTKTRSLIYNAEMEYTAGWLACKIHIASSCQAKQIQIQTTHYEQIITMKVPTVTERSIVSH